VIEMLQALNDRGIKTAVVSNKYDAAVGALCAHYFGILVQVAVGEGNGVAKKPSPDGALKALRLLNVDASEALFVGDSDVDVHTAHNALLPCAGVTWGFRSREVLIQAGADMLIDTPNQILTLALGGM
jgi:phosphoglycolate phosphatase